MNKLLQQSRFLLILISLLFSFELFSQVATTGDGTILGGFMVYARDGWNSSAMRGFYTFVADEDPEITNIKIEPYKDLISGISRDGKYYSVSREYNIYTGLLYYYYYVFDMDTWNQVDYKVLDDVDAALALAYDPTTETIYALSTEVGMSSYLKLSTYDLETATATDIGEITGEDIPLLGFVSFSVDVNGEIYGITYNGNFYRIDKNTAEATLIGELGVTPNGVSSMVFDHKTNKLYWASCLMDFYANLYEIDIETGLAYEIAKFPRNEAFAGIFVVGPAAPDEAPGKPLNLEVTAASQGSLTNTIRFTAPATTYRGEIPLETLSAEIWINEELVKAEENINPGTEFSYEITFEEPAEKKVEVYLINDAGKSPKAKAIVWVGPDRPVAVTNLYYQRVQQGDALLTWSAPTTGVNNGYLDLSTLSYEVKRNEDGEIIVTNLRETTFTDENAPESRYYTYTITPVSSGGKGESITTGKVYVGESLPLPYQETFDTRAAFDNYWSIFNLNGGDTWVWNSTMSDVRYSNNKNETADDWAISSPVFMSKDHLYKISYILSSQNPNYPENCNVMLGTDSDPEVHSTLIAEYKELKTNFNDAEPYTNFIAVPEDQEYYLGFYCYSEEQGWNLIVDDVTIEEIPIPAIEDLAGRVTNQDVSLTWSQPEEIEEVPLIGYHLYRDGEKITETPIESNSYEEKEMQEGSYTYQVTAVYEWIESSLSNSYTAIVRKPDQLPEDSSPTYDIIVQKGEILLKGVMNHFITILTSDGQQLMKERNKQTQLKIEVRAGIYLIKIEDQVHKVAVW